MSEQGIVDIIRKAYIDGWGNTPIPALSLSAGGLIALADLHTIAKRTVIKGGSSWLDALVLAPGLHYQQAADALDRDSAAGLSAELGLTAAVETTADGKTVQHHKINNVALTNFLKRMAINGPKDETVTLNVGAMKQREEIDVLIRKFNAISSKRSGKTMAATSQDDEPDESDKENANLLSHLLYIATPLLTVSSSTLMAVLGDWWGFGFIVALMASRLLNIWIIKQRVKTGIDIPTVPEPTLDSLVPQLAPVQSTETGSSSTIAAASVAEGEETDKTTREQQEEAAAPKPEKNPATEYTIDLGGNRKVVLRGLTNDLQALTSPTFLRNKTDTDGYLEALAKLIVYMVASFSGNLSQSGAIVLMVLLLSSAGLLGLSNSQVRDLQMNGRVARPDMAVGCVVDEESGRRTGIAVENLRGRRVKTS